MSSGSSRLDTNVHLSSEELDVSRAEFSLELSKVWSDEKSGEIAIPIDRILFDSLPEVVARYLEPNGYSLNFENIISTIESATIAVLAVRSKAMQGGPVPARKILPAIFMRLPNKSRRGALLSRFYEEVARYESEIEQLRHEKTKSGNALPKNKTGTASPEAEISQLRTQLQILHERIAELTKHSVGHTQNSTDRPVEPLLIKTDQIKHFRVQSVRPNDRICFVMVGDVQMTVGLHQMNGLPVPGAVGYCRMGGDQIAQAWVCDPIPQAFTVKIVEVIALDEFAVKLRSNDRKEFLVRRFEEINARIGSSCVARFANGQLIELLLPDGEGVTDLPSIIFDEQTVIKLNGKLAK